MTHTPPRFILDSIEWQGSIVHPGDGDLRRRVEEVKPLLHVFGHLHESKELMLYIILLDMI